MKAKKCRHDKGRITTYLNLMRKPTVIVTCDYCQNCGEWFGLGPAKDTPDVEVEIRAAELAAAAVDDPDMIGAQLVEWHGWDDHAAGRFRPDCSQLSEARWNAGWLAREIEMHDREQG